MRDFPKIVGVLNITPDSFSDGGCFLDTTIAVEQGISLHNDGADIIDIGGESTKPGSNSVSEQQELDRVIPVIHKLKSIIPELLISIDTSKYNVALEAVKQGAKMINDISALDNDSRLAGLAADWNIPLVLMHKQGTPKEMQNNPQYINVVEDIYNELKRKIEIAKNYGVTTIIADPGIGFGKTYEHNIEVLKNIDIFSNLDVPIMLGISRKAFLGHLTGIEKPQERDIATALLHALLLSKKIDFIRVHNVKLISLLKTLFSALK